MDFDELVARKMQRMTRAGTLEFVNKELLGNAQAYDAAEQTENAAECEAARRLLIVMRNELIGGNHANINETPVPLV